MTRTDIHDDGFGTQSGQMADGAHIARDREAFAPISAASAPESSSSGGLPDAPQPGAMSHRYPSAARAWYVTGVLLLTVALSYLDRMVLSLLILPIQADLRLTDTAMGLLLGPAFIFLYAVAALPLGYLVDRYNRRNVLVCGLAIWTTGTLVCGFSRTFATLAMGRALVGIGEACVVPCCYSIVADCFAPEKRGRAIGIVSLGLSIGTGTALFGGGLLFRFATTIGHLPWRMVDTLLPWQIVFMCCGLPGLLVIALLFTVREPARPEPPATRHASDPGHQGFGTFLRANAGSLAIVLTGYVLYVLILYAVASWTPAMFSRRLGVSVSNAAFVSGGVTITVGPLFVLVGGVVGDWMSKRSPDGRLRMAALISPIYLPGILLFTLAPNIILSSLGLALLSIPGFIIGTSVYATVQEMSPDRYRGRMLSLYVLLAGLLGTMPAASLVALMTDHVFKDPARVNLSMLAVGAPGAVIGSALFWWGLPGFRRMRSEA